MALAAMLCAVLPAGAQDGPEAGDDARYSFHGEVRTRWELNDNYRDFDDKGGFYDPMIPALYPDDNINYFPYRVRLGVEGQLLDELAGLVELQSAGAFGVRDEQRDVLFSNADPVDLYQAFLHWAVSGTGLSLRFGRQEVVDGNQFLFGNFEYDNGASFDGFRLRYDIGSGGTHFDFRWLRTNDTFEVDADTDILTLAFSGEAERGDEWSVYTHYVRDDRPSGIDRETVMVFGFQWTRMNRGGSHLLWNAEGAWQDGRVGNPSEFINGLPTGITLEDRFISAWGGEGSLGYNWNRGENDQRLYAHLYWASGDQDRTDREDNAFRTLFQDHHLRLGRADLVRGTNVISLGLAYEAYRGERHAAGFDLLGFLIARPEDSDTVLASFPGRFDGLRILAGNVNPDPAIDPSETDLGQEVDVWYEYFYSRNVSVMADLAVFLPGNAVSQATGGFDDPALRLAVQARLRF